VLANCKNPREIRRFCHNRYRYIVYPHYKHHPEIQQPLEHTTVRVEVQLGAPVPEGMTGSVHLAWYDPNNTVANRSTPAQSGHGTRDNGEDMVLGTAGDPLPGFTLNFKVKPPKERGPETMDRRLTSYLTVADARYGDNFIVVAHSHEDIEKTYEFRENASQQLVLMHPENTGLWKELPNGKDPSGQFDPTVPDLQTSILTIFPSVDIDCDSDNTATPTSHGIQRSDFEESIENEAGYAGKWVWFNGNDDNENSIDDYLENAAYGYPGGGSWVPFTDPDLVPVVLDRGFEDLSDMEGFVFELKVTLDRGLSYWLDSEKTPITANQYQTITEAGKQKGLYRWIVTGAAASYPPLIYVEGVDGNALTDTLIWRLLKPSGETYEQLDADTVKMTNPRIDLDVDSNNNGMLERNLAEESVEDTANEPGKIIRARLADYSDNDRIPDFADGYNRDRIAGNDDDLDDSARAFAVLVLHVLDGIDLSVARIKFDYSASDPMGVGESGGVYTPAPDDGMLRIWKKKAREARNGSDAASGGDYVAPHIGYTAAQLDLGGVVRIVGLGIEGIRPGVTTVKVLVDPDGPGGSCDYIVMDTVKVTVVYVDLDVDNNGALFDAVDGVNNYLPGYEGTTNKLTTGATFNTVSYVAQHMQIIAEGIGSGQGVDAVSFQISKTTTLTGYAENKTAYMVTSPIRNDDYSFELTANRRSAFGTMTASNTFADFYCKDYGGSATVVVSLIKNGAAVFTWPLGVPTDTDQDGLADTWERVQIAEWNQQYGYSHPVNDLTFVSPTSDWEMADPDRNNTDGGTDLPAHKTVGDSLTGLQEYRGFILDGGNGHAGGHKRLSTARKELLVEVDIMDGVTHMPTESGIRDTMDIVSAGFNDLTDGAGIDVYYVIDERAARHEVFGSDSAWNTWMDNHRHRTNGVPNMLNEFVYVSWVDIFTHRTTTLGLSHACGASTAVERIHARMPAGTNFSDVLAHTTAHELTHLIIDTINANGFDSGEHLDDPNENGTIGDADDERYLMSNHRTWIQRVAIIFSNPTRRQIDLTNKDSVE
jgi:hypothetical protein